MSAPEDRVVVTFWLSDRDRLDGKRPIQHAYGPYTLSKARRVKKEMEAEAIPEPGMVWVSICKPINVEAWNAANNQEEDK